MTSDCTMESLRIFLLSVFLCFCSKYSLHISVRSHGSRHSSVTAPTIRLLLHVSVGHLQSGVPVLLLSCSEALTPDRRALHVASGWISQGCHSKVPQPGVLPVLSSGGQKSKIKKKQGWSPLRSVMKSLSHTLTPASNGLLANSGVPWLIKALPHHPNFYLQVPTAFPPRDLPASRFPLHVRTPVIKLVRAYPNDLMLTQSPLHRPCLQKRSQPQVWGLGFPSIFFRAHHSFRTASLSKWKQPC